MSHKTEVILTFLLIISAINFGIVAAMLHERPVS